jgi:hypothetical protein
MAWCPHCNQDRPIHRQNYAGKCPHCDQGQIVKFRDKEVVIPHNPDCRGPVPNALDVCTYCNTPVFAKALDKQMYDSMESAESQIEKPKSACFVVTATMGDADNPVVKDMRYFRDEFLHMSSLGRTFISYYQIYGPKLATKIERSYFRRLLCYILVVFPAHLIIRFIFLLRRLIAERRP